MKVPFNSEVLIIGAIIAQGFFAGSLLFFFNNNRRANRFLAVLLGLFSLWLCDTFFRVAEIYQQNPNFYFLPIYFSFAFGPLIYFYTRSLTEKEFRFKSKYLLHFVPAFFQFCLYLFLQIKDYEYRRWFWMDVHQPYTYDLEFVLSLLSMTIYLAFSLKAVRLYHEWIKNNFSDISRIKLNWLRYTHLVLALICVLWIVDAVTRSFTGTYPDKPLSSMSIGVSILFLAIGALRQQELKEVAKVMENKPMDLSEAIEPNLLVKIKAAMDQDQLYLKNELTLKEFAKFLEEPARKVSRHINLGLNLSFIDFVNNYRVEEVKQRITKGESEHLSLFGIALESGFNSKPTFNRVFKKITGKSPSEYQKRFKTSIDKAQNRY